ncbi:hypothetical protein E8E11_001326 [Didymella keratinophila]|nr:hypothetical protein E8E11_001326 [Didymella keratinophila]
MWSSTGFFQITLGGGNLTFAEAKVVDIAWDIGVGRGGQLLLAIISWREFARYLTISMESEPVTYQVFRTIFIENDASVLSTCRTIKSFILHRGLRSNVAMAFMTATMILILAFPTLVSAMSGYDSNVASRIEDLDGNFIAFNNYSKVLYIIHDGWRVNLTGDYLVTDLKTKSDPVISTHTNCYYYGYYRNKEPDCNLLFSVDQLRFFADQKPGKNFTLKAPVLNISAYASDYNELAGQNTSGIQTWTRDNQTIDLTYIENNKHGKCQNTGDYQWGFSFLQLFICIVLLLAWTIGIYIMWIYTHNTLALRKRLPEQIAGEHRAVLELAAAMQKELEIDDIEPSVRGGAVSYAYPESQPYSFSIRKGFASWFKADKWWFLSMFVTSALIGTGWLFFVYSTFGFWAYFWLPSLWFGQFWAFCIGSTTGSRLLIILFWSLMGAIVVSSTFAGLYASDI